MEDQRLADEQQQGEDRPHAHHRVHPPEIEAAEAAPQIELRHHVEPARPDEENGGARLPDEAMLDCVERAQPIGAEIAAAHGRERHRGRHRDAADPDDDRKHMERAGEGEIIHDRRLLPKIDRRCTPFARAKVALAQTRARRGDYAAAMARIRFEDDAIEVDARAIAEGLRTTPERRSEEHTSDLQSLMSISYAVFCLKK